jgi:hypothetical protein
LLTIFRKEEELEWGREGEGRGWRKGGRVPDIAMSDQENPIPSKISPKDELFKEQIYIQ